MLGYVRLDDLPKFHAAYFATRRDPSVFIQPPCQPDTDALEKNVEHKLLDQYDGFALKPKTLIEIFKENPNPSFDVAAR